MISPGLLLAKQFTVGGTRPWAPWVWLVLSDHESRLDYDHTSPCWALAENGKIMCVSRGYLKKYCGARDQDG